MREVILILPYPHRPVREPTEDQIKNALEGSPPNHGRVGEVWLIVSASCSSSSTKRLWFYLKSSEEMIAFYDTGRDNEWLVSVGDKSLDEEFEVLDDGGASWKLNTRYIIPVKKGIEHALNILKHGGLFDSDDWCEIPNDFVG